MGTRRNSEEGRLDEKLFVEELALLFEQLGPPRMAGRILGRLLISEAPCESLDSLADALEASKASMSTTARMLVQLGYLERVAVPGERRDHYRIRRGAWAELHRQRLAAIGGLRALAQRGLDLCDDDHHQRARERLVELRRFCAFLERELPALIDRYEEEQRCRAQAPTPSSPRD